MINCPRREGNLTKSGQKIRTRENLQALKAKKKEVRKQERQDK